MKSIDFSRHSQVNNDLIDVVSDVSSAVFIKKWTIFNVLNVQLQFSEIFRPRHCA